MRKKVTVLADDIAKGKTGWGSAYSCPIALAIKRAFPYSHYVEVTQRTITVDTTTYHTPVKAEKFINAADNMGHWYGKTWISDYSKTECEETVKPFGFFLSTNLIVGSTLGEETI
jgi:hypothetical protein